MIADIRFNLVDALEQLAKERTRAIDAITSEHERLVAQLQLAHSVSADEIPTLESAAAATVTDISIGREHEPIRSIGVCFNHSGWTHGQVQLHDPLQAGDWRVIVLVTPRPKVRT